MTSHVTYKSCLDKVTIFFLQSCNLLRILKIVQSCTGFLGVAGSSVTIICDVMREFKLLISYALIVPGVLNTLHNSTTDLYSHITYVTLCTNLFLYPIARPLSYYTSIHIQLVDVYIYMHMHTVYIHHHNTHHRLVVVDSHARHAQ